jgi:hypothetical protein
MLPTCGHAGFYLLWGANSSRGWRVINYKVSYAEGRRKVEQGKWREVYDDVSSVMMGFQVISTAAARGDCDIKSSDNHSAAIDDDEMQTNAGCAGESRTARMSEDNRDQKERTGRCH